MSIDPPTYVKALIPAFEAASAAVRATVQVGPFGPNALSLVTQGGHVSLTPAEADAAGRAAVEAAAPLIEAAVIADAVQRIQVVEDHLPAMDRYPDHTITAGLHLAVRIARGEA